MSVKIVLQNAKAQLEAQKQKTYQEAYSEKYGQLKVTIDAYILEKKKEYDEAVVALKMAYEDAINAKKTEVETLASSYAQMKMSALDVSIAELQKMIDNAGER